MNFIDAVRELAEGRCEGIKREGWEESVVWLLVSTLCVCDPRDILIVEARSRQLYSPSSEHIFADDWQLVNPKPVMEEVEITAYLTTFDSGDTDPILSDHVPVFPFSKGHVTQSHTFKYSRPVAKKVKRREKLSIDSFTPLSIKASRVIGTLPISVEIYAEWLQEEE